MFSCGICKNMSDHTLDMLAFVRTIQAGSLSGAARTLGVSLAVISRRLTRLEERLGVRLINRSTRSLSATEEGARFFARCVRILAEIDDAETEAASGKDTASGLLKVTTTFAFGRRWLAPLLNEFQQQQPGLHIHLDTDDGVSNIVEKGYDVAVRFGALADSSLVARQLAPNRRVICASPTYLNLKGRPRSLEDLQHHDVIGFGDPLNLQWTLATGETVALRSRFTTNNGEVAHQLALDGAGLILKSIWDVQDDLERQQLELVLPSFQLPAAPIHAVVPNAKLAAAKVRLCMDYLGKRLKVLSRRMPG
jgi:DNA-binding transcriptional LysR family regulator